MRIVWKNWLLGAISGCAAVAGLVLLGAVAASGDAIGRSVGALIGGGFAFGVLGCSLKEVAAHLRDNRLAALRAASPESYASAPAALFAMPPVADATASEFDDIDQPAFAPVRSLTEAQVERRLAGRRRHERHTTQNRA